MIKDEVDQEYEDGRVTVMTDDEMLEKITRLSAELGITIGNKEEADEKQKTGI